MVTGVVTWCLLFLTILGYRFVCGKDNARREAEMVVGSLQGQSSGHGEVLLDDTGAPKGDLTDREDKEFQYSL